MFEYLKHRIRILLSPSIELIKHNKVSTGDVTYKINFKAHFLSAWLEINQPFTSKQHTEVYAWYYTVAKKEAERFGATFKTKETFSI